VTDVLAVDAVEITKRFGAIRALDAISVAVAQGEVYGVLGPNGAGKTTLLRMLFGLIRPDGGTLKVLGRSWPTDGVRTLEGVAGFIESPKFYPYLSGRRNLELLAALDGRRERERIDEVLDVVEMVGRAGDKVGGYSFGMRQRLGVAAALLRSPKLLVLDEPANGLDPAGIRDMRALVKRLAAEGLTVLLSSHDMAEVEDICDNVTIMRTGTVIYHGTIATLRERAPDPENRLRTSDDSRAISLAAGHPDVTAFRADGSIAVRGAQLDIDAYIATLVSAGVALRSLTMEETPLEELFFMLTERDVDDAEHGRPSLSGVSS
jgi:ABC-2 type transport system ATP-binding protein